MEKINKNSTLMEILKYPRAEKILKKNNFPCLMCPFVKYEMESLKIKDVCKMYNIDIKKLLKELEKIVLKKTNKK